MSTFYPTPNNVSTTTTGYTSGSGSIALASGTGTLFGSTFPLVFSTLLADGTEKGIYSCTGRSTDTLTGLTLLSGTDANIPAGGFVQIRWTHEHVAQLTTAINTIETDKAPLASPTFTGTPAAPTASFGTNTTQLATTAFVIAGLAAAIPQSQITGLVSDLAAKAPLASPTFTGTPAAPTATAGTNTTQLATTAFVTTAFAAAIPESQVTDLVSDLAAKAPLASPTFTGTPAAPTASFGTNTTQLATTAFVIAGLAAAIPQSQVTNLVSDLAAKAPLASPTFTGTPAAPTATAGTNTTQLATTAFVTTAQAAAIPESQVTNLVSDLATKAPLASPVFTGKATIPARDGGIGTATDGATVTFDFSSVDKRSVTLGADRTLAVTGDTDGQQFTLILTCGNVANNVIWWSGIRWTNNNTQPTLSVIVGRIDVITFIKLGSGSYLGFPVALGM